MNINVREVCILGAAMLQITTPGEKDFAQLFGGEAAEIVLREYPDTPANRRLVATMQRTAERPREVPF
jgi:hypothetical protein